MRLWIELGRRLWVPAILLTVMCVPVGWAQSQTPPAASAQAAPAPKLDAPVRVGEAGPPSAEELAKGDPGGSMTGTVNDIAVADAKKGLTLGDALNQIGQNKVAINFTWTLIAGFLVMFMQAGFALVETGLCRAKNANHTMMMNFMVYGFGLFAFWVCGFALQMGGVGATANLGGTAPLSSEFTVSLLGKTWGLFGTHGFFLTQGGGRGREFRRGPLRHQGRPFAGRTASRGAASCRKAGPQERGGVFAS